MNIYLVISSDFGNLSRGRHSARKGNGQNVTWASKDKYGRLEIKEPGIWYLHSTDGFSRIARATLEVKPDGSYEIVGAKNRFKIS